MSFVAPLHRLRAEREPSRRPFSWRSLLPRRKGAFREILRQQAEILRLACASTSATETDQLYRDAAARHVAARGRLCSSFFTPFDAEDLAELLGAVVRVARARHRIARSGSTAFRNAEQAAAEWASTLADLIPDLPRRDAIDPRSVELRSHDARLRREIRQAQVEAVGSASGITEILLRQEEQKRWQTLHTDLRWLSVQLLRVRYRNG